MLLQYFNPPRSLCHGDRHANFGTAIATAVCDLDNRCCILVELAATYDRSRGGVKKRQVVRCIAAHGDGRARRPQEPRSCDVFELWWGAIRSRRRDVSTEFSQGLLGG